MTIVEQHNMIKQLGEYAHKMRGKDLDEFEMMRKRDKDDEELDDIRRRRLMELFRTYVPERYRI
ncbi:MAG TPA: hypothetical protein VMW43_01270 [Bacteroidota bacterium]|nr:hypothetical protein [Bacteroidota bacterium]